MTEAGFFGGGVGMPRNHRLVPVFDLVARMFYAALFDPTQNCVVVLQTMNRVFESIAVEFEKAEEMFVEPDRLVIVTIKQSLAMELGLVDQTRKMNVAAEFFVWTARMQSSHGGKAYVACRGWGAPAGPSGSAFFPAAFASGNNSP